MSDYFTLTCKAIGLPEPIPEYKFHSKKKWKIDYVFENIKLAIEIEGGAWMPKGGGRHNQSQGFINDMEKYNALTELGWRLLRYIPQKIDFDQIKKVYTILILNKEKQ